MTYRAFETVSKDEAVQIAMTALTPYGFEDIELRNYGEPNDGGMAVMGFTAISTEPVNDAGERRCNVCWGVYPETTPLTAAYYLSAAMGIVDLAAGYRGSLS